MIISQVYLQQLQQQNTPHFIVYFFRKSKNQKKNTNKKVRRAIKMNDALTIKLCTSKNKNKKTKIYILDSCRMTSWKKSDSQMSHFRSLFFRAFVKVSLKVTLNKTKNKTPLCLLFLLSECVVEEKLLLVIHHLKDLSLFCIIFITFFGTQ